jgi:hypothetical protein
MVGAQSSNEWSGVNNAATTSNNVLTFVATANIATIGYGTSTATTFGASYISCLPIVPQANF